MGNGGTTDTHAPVAISGLSNIVAIAAGMTHALALDSDGHVWAWGDNSHGQLGTGNTTNHLTPVQVPDLDGVAAIGAGDGFSAVVLNDGTVWTWGNNADGELGNNSTTSSLGPVQAGPFSDATHTVHIVTLKAGPNYVIARGCDGTIWTWGGNASGQLGHGNDTNSLVPGLVAVNLKQASASDHGYPASWAALYPGLTGDANSDSDGDGVTNIQEYQLGSDPTNYYNRGSMTITPTLTIYSGDSQSAPQVT